jgi:FixJ family two-component response regulator
VKGYPLSRSAKQIVIVVDDDSQIRESLESLLESAEFGVATFPSAEAVLESDTLAEASCLITDVRMPGMQGTELQHRTKRDYPQLPVIVITGHRDGQIKERALSNGAAFLLYKPFDPDDLLHAVRSAIRDSAKEV